MSDWVMRPFGELYAEPSRNGLTRPKRVRGTGYKMVNMGEIFAHDRIWNPPMDLVPLSDLERQSFDLKPGDLLFARQSLVAAGAGKCSIVMSVPEPTTFESHLIRVRLDQTRACPLFYFYYFQSHVGRGAVQSLVMQVAAAGIRGSELSRLPVQAPPVGPQRRIASILSAYDNLIENNTRRIAILEEMARALYREWFVHFRFPAFAKATAGRPGRERVKMVESPLGPIPEGWDVQKVKALIKRLAAGRAYKEADVSGVGAVPVVDQARGRFLGFHDNTPDLVASPEQPIVIFGDHTCRTQLMIEPFSVGPNVVPFVSADDRPTLFLYFCVRNLVETREYKRHWTELTNKTVVVAPREQSLCFAAITLPMLQQATVLNKTNLNLMRTRDLLLPKLISGEIDVSRTAEAPLEATA